MVIKVEVEDNIGIVGATFSNKEEYDAFVREVRKRLKEKANQMRITDIEKAKRKYETKIMDQILEEYLLHHPPSPSHFHHHS